MTDRIPVTVLTGFLGAGKTTLLNRLLARPAMAGAAVVVNEFGDVGIDHHLVARVAGDMLLLTTGCLCCMARGDLVGALEDLVDRRADGRASFDRILIETTGLAEPGPVLNALLPRPGFDTCHLDALITVVDAVGGMAMIDASDEAIRQIAMADVIVVSKLDLLSGDGREGLTDVTRGLRALNPSAPIIPAAAAPAYVTRPDARPPVPVSPSLLPREEENTDLARRGSPSSIAAEGAPPPRRGAEGRIRGSELRRHLHDIESVVLEAGALDPRRFELFVDRAIARHGADLLRLKGLLATPATPDRPTLINVVQHRIHPAAPLDAWPDADRRTRLVAIARGAAAREIALLWDDVFGPPRIDRPDAGALIGEAGPGLF